MPDLPDELYEAALIDGANDRWFAHDVELFDLDGDGRAEELVVNYQKGYWNAPWRIY